MYSQNQIHPKQHTQNVFFFLLSFHLIHSSAVMVWYMCNIRHSPSSTLKHIQLFLSLWFVMNQQIHTCSLMSSLFHWLNGHRDNMRGNVNSETTPPKARTIGRLFSDVNLNPWLSVLLWTKRWPCCEDVCQLHACMRSICVCNSF